MLAGQLKLLQAPWKVIVATIDEAIEALHLSPALEVLHAAMAIAGDQTAQVTLLSRSHLHPFHGIVGIFCISHWRPHLIFLLTARNGRIV